MRGRRTGPTATNATGQTGTTTRWVLPRNSNRDGSPSPALTSAHPLSPTSHPLSPASTSDRPSRLLATCCSQSPESPGAAPALCCFRQQLQGGCWRCSLPLAGALLPSLPSLLQPLLRCCCCYSCCRCRCCCCCCRRCWSCLSLPRGFSLSLPARAAPGFPSFPLVASRLVSRLNGLLPTNLTLVHSLLTPRSLIPFDPMRNTLAAGGHAPPKGSLDLAA